MDEALGLPSEPAALLALRTQQVVAFESGVADTVDPLAGSYFVEALTDQLESRARAYLEQIDALGGAVRAIERGFQQREIHEAAYRWQKRVERGEAVVVGVNRFADGASARPEVLRVDEDLHRQRAERLRALRAKRNAAEAERALAAIEESARRGAEIMPAVVDAVSALATLGEVSDRLRAVFGSHRETFAF
jgi:methylmalonyl-CoA mutase N-terminal domain/subunit